MNDGFNEAARFRRGDGPVDGRRVEPNVEASMRPLAFARGDPRSRRSSRSSGSCFNEAARFRARRPAGEVQYANLTCKLQ